MKWRFAWVYRLGLAVLLAVGFWSVWAHAQETNALDTTVTNAPALLKFKLSGQL